MVDGLADESVADADCTAVSSAALVVMVTSTDTLAAMMVKEIELSGTFKATARLALNASWSKLPMSVAIVYVMETCAPMELPGDSGGGGEGGGGDGGGGDTGGGGSKGGGGSTGGRGCGNQIQPEPDPSSAEPNISGSPECWPEPEPDELTAS
eukprot:1810920-Prymnesium_polylepis.3